MNRWPCFNFESIYQISTRVHLLKRKGEDRGGVGGVLLGGRVVDVGVVLHHVERVEAVATSDLIDGLKLKFRKAPDE